MTIARAPLDAADELSALARRSKAHWGYPEAWLEHWKPLLTIGPEYMQRHEVWLARGDAGYLGWYALEREAEGPVGAGSGTARASDGPSGFVIPTQSPAGAVTSASPVSLGHFWIEPRVMGQGLGRALFQHARARAAVQGMGRMKILADPHAEEFYRRMAARRIGEEPGDFDRTLPILEIPTRPGDDGTSRELLHVAQTFAQALDHEAYPLAHGLIARHCEYQVGDDTHRGPDAVIASYRASGDWVNETLDGVAYESHVERLAANGARITFVDHIRHAGRSHTHSCHQVITLDETGFIARIEHHDLPGEPESVSRFLDEVGVDRGE